MGLFSQISFSSDTFRNYINFFLANGFQISIQTLIQNLRIILRIAIKVKINILLTSPPPILVLPVPITLKMLVGVPMLLGIKVPIIPLIIILKWKKRLLLLLLVFKLLSGSFLLLIKQLYMVLLKYFQDALQLRINFIFQGCLCSKLQ